MTVLRTTLLTFALIFPAAAAWPTGIAWGEAPGAVNGKRAPVAADRIDLVKKKASLIREVKGHRLKGSIETFEYLLDRLDVFAAVADEVVPHMKGHKARELSPGVFFANDEEGVYGEIERTFETPGSRFFYGDGGCKVLFMTYTGSGVAELTFYEMDGGENDGVAVVDLHFYAKLDDFTARIMAGLMNVFVPKLLDRKLAMFFDSLDLVMEVVEGAPVEVRDILVAKGVFVDAAAVAEFDRRFVRREVVLNE